MLQFIDALTGANVEAEVEKVALAYTYLGGVTLVALFLETAMFMWAGAWRSDVAYMCEIHACACSGA